MAKVQAAMVSPEFWGARSRAEQGLPPKIENPAFLRLFYGSDTPDRRIQAVAS